MVVVAMVVVTMVVVAMVMVVMVDVGAQLTTSSSARIASNLRCGKHRTMPRGHMTVTCHTWPAPKHLEHCFMPAPRQPWQGFTEAV